MLMNAITADALRRNRLQHQYLWFRKSSAKPCCTTSRSLAIQDDRRGQREGILFLEQFVETVSQPTPKDGREHVSYAPTQVMSEFFALIFKDGDGSHIQGSYIRAQSIQRGATRYYFRWRAKESEPLKWWSSRNQPKKQSRLYSLRPQGESGRPSLSPIYGYCQHLSLGSRYK